MAHAELRAAITAFLHSWIGREWFARHPDGDFNRLLDMVEREKGFLEMFQKFHDEFNRYPTFEELSPFRFYDKPPSIPDSSLSEVLDPLLAIL